ncbi:hypothetical protein SGUI_1719 [Serinicoccus hydrothermalis]|uniref:Methylamine utilisation protein MauE domain-containing protein n=1 Tax=Serinicoccus hydrothermalis TaxID=1758689 RepID=A0A1B1NCL7_9MICO|nr:MauE/DoxX family redox-associated membrane protein [Serinicoccus hydrothermalis]ANS79115.1 hypothetical protein SGUI_1719 [Serinicoccus hydrothermalis]
MSLLGGAGALAVGLVLLAAGVGHLRGPRDTARALRAHGVLPGGSVGPVARTLGPLEVCLGLGLLVAATGLLPPGPARLLALAGTALCLAFAAYLWVVQRRVAGAPVPCGCGLGTTPVGPWAVARAGVLAALALLAVLAPVTGWQDAPGAPAGAQLAVAVLAGGALAVATAALPAARAVPEQLTTLARVPR